ncbi:MAG: hypothetical protein ABI813_16145 [Bacteroidota bacterium]
MRLLFILLLLPLAFCVRAQSVTGSWYGIAEASSKGVNNNNYLTELIITQKGNEVEGIFGYYFRSGYQSYYVRGRYNPKTRLLTIKNIPVTYFKSLDIDGIDCPMNFSATLFTSKVQSKLTGAFVSQEKYKYTCPQLNFSYTLDVNEKNQDSVIRNEGTVKKYWKPRNEELVINTKDITAVSQLKEPVITGLKKDSAALKAVDTARKKDLEKLVSSFEQRKTIKSKEVEIESDSVRISFYDNGDIDGDSISVFINKVPVLTHQLLSEKALNMYLAMDISHPLTEITMYAENLGIYPPNTALMIITDGLKIHEVFLSSSLTQNASVILRKKKR